MNEFRVYYERHLPHYQPPDATLFVTFRLAGSLPAHVIEQLRREAQFIEQQLAAIVDPGERTREAYVQNLRMFGRWDAALDNAVDVPRWLAQPPIAACVTEGLHWRDGRDYTLSAYCIMPTHVHLVAKPLRDEQDVPRALSVIMQSLKSRTGRRANQLLGREGAFWQYESYDHVVRDDAELGRILDYVIKNPVKAGLVAEPKDWPYTYCTVLP